MRHFLVAVALSGFLCASTSSAQPIGGIVGPGAPIGVQGPTSATSGNVVTFNGTTGKLVQDSGAAIGTSGAAIPLLNGNNVYSGTSSFTADLTASGSSLRFTNDNSPGAGPNIFAGSSLMVFQANTAGFQWNNNAGNSGLMTLSNAGLFALPQITSDATHTDAAVCEDTTSHAFYSGSGTLGVCLGTSSRRFKTGIAPIEPGLAEILRLQPVSFYLDRAHGDPKKQMYGFIAEDMVKVLPKLVALDKQGRPNAADYLGVVPVLVRAVQEQQKEIIALKSAGLSIKKEIDHKAH